MNFKTINVCVLITQFSKSHLRRQAGGCAAIFDSGTESIQHGAESPYSL